MHQTGHLGSPAIFNTFPSEKWWLLGLLGRPAEGQGLAVLGYGNEIWNGNKYGNIWNHHLLNFFGNMELDIKWHSWKNLASACKSSAEKFQRTSPATEAGDRSWLSEATEVLPTHGYLDTIYYSPKSLIVSSSDFPISSSSDFYRFLTSVCFITASLAVVMSHMWFFFFSDTPAGCSIKPQLKNLSIGSWPVAKHPHISPPSVGFFIHYPLVI